MEVGVGNSAEATASKSTTSSNRNNRNFSPNNPNSPNGDSTSTQGLTYNKETPDSVMRQKVFRFNLLPHDRKIYTLSHPTLSPTGVQNHDVLDATNFGYYLSKGVIGQSHISLYPQLYPKVTYRLQPDPHPATSKSIYNIWLYQTQTPYTRLAYHSSVNADYQLQATHSQNIMPGWNVAVDYRLTNPEGVYTNSGVKNSQFDITTNYFSPDSRIQAKAGFIWQSFRLGENGGITDDTYFTQRRQSNRAGIPVNIYDTVSRDIRHTVFAQASYSLVQQSNKYREHDSITSKIVGDTAVITDTIHLIDTIQPRSARVINAGVVGIEGEYNHEKRVFTDSTTWHEATMTLYWTNDAYMDHRWHNPLKITIGAKPRLIRATIEDSEYQSASWLNPFAKVVVSGKRLSLTLDGELSGAFSNEMDYSHNATFRYDADSLHRHIFVVRMTAQHRSPDLRMLHSTNFDLQGTDYLQGMMAYDYSDKLSIDLKATHIKHHLWYDSALIPRSGITPLWLLQGRINAHFGIKWLHCNMQQILQYSTDNLQLPVPLWASKNSVYADITLFNRALRTQIGVDVRYHTLYFAPSYDPYTGVFYQQHETEVGNYLWLDAFINIQVKRASIYLKGGHVNALWDENPNFFLIPHYPGLKFGLYWGVVWNFFD